MTYRCPTCGNSLTCHAGLGPRAAPGASDVSVCAHCFSGLVFTPAGLRLATPDEERRHAGDFGPVRAELTRLIFRSGRGARA